MRHVLDSALEQSSERIEVLYVYRGKKDGHFKIGRTKDPVGKRQKDFSGRGPGYVETEFLVAVPMVRDGKSEEDDVHNYFDAQRWEDGSEWFYWCVEIEEWVRWLKNQTYALNREDLANDYRLRAECRKHVTKHWTPGAEKRIRSAAAIEDDGALFPRERTSWDDDLVGETPQTENDYYTPKYVTDAARLAMGSIDTDPATHYEANKIIQAETCYTLQTNGLIRDWKGNVWCNPPFAQWEKWVPKILSEYKSGRVTAICVLYHGKTEVNHCMSPLICAADAIWTPKGRIRFWGGRARDAKSMSPMDGSKVAYLGPDVDSFVREFSKLGGSVKR